MVLEYSLKSHDPVCMMYLSSGSITKSDCRVRMNKISCHKYKLQRFKIMFASFICQMSVMQVASIREYSIVNSKEYLNAKKP